MIYPDSFITARRTEYVQRRADNVPPRRGYGGGNNLSYTAVCTVCGYAA